MVWGSGVLGMKFHHLFLGIVEVFQILLCVPLYSIAFPFDQILEFLSEHPTVQDFFHNIFPFSINKFRWRQCVLTSSNNRVIWSQGQLHHIEDRMEASHRWRKGQAIGIPSDASLDWIGAKAVV